MAPFSDILYACDYVWWNHYKGVPEFKGEKWSHKFSDGSSPNQGACVDHWGLNYKFGTYGVGLGRNVLHYGSNSGYQAINLAYLLGANKIIMLGYDMQRTGGKGHWHRDHPKPINVGSEFPEWLRRFPQLAKELAQEGVDVVNCTRETALTCFRKETLENEFTLINSTNM